MFNRLCYVFTRRAVETRGGDKKPMLSDLRDSGSIEQDADIVQFLYRPEYYGFENDIDGNSTKGKAYVLIKKNRNGALKDIEFNFIGNLTKFTDKTIEQPSQIKPNTEFDMN